MNKLYLLCISSIILLTLSACKKDVDIFDPYTLVTKVDMGNIVTVNLMGTVFDEDFKAMSNVKVVIGNKQFYTDENGVFIAPNSSLYSKVGHLKFEKPGYFTLPKSISVGSSKDYSIQIMMKKRNLTETFNAETGGTVTQQAVQLEFPANALVNEQGTPYTGPVRAYMANFNPDNMVFAYNMPGILIGEREDESAVVLETFGMIAVELEGSQGQKLNIAEGKTVSAVYQIPETAKSYAPAEMPLWSMTANDPFWREEGFAVREGDTYVAEFSHFSYWNYDYPGPAAEISFTLTDADGNAFGNQFFKIHLIGGGMTVAGYTNGSGYAEGFVPANENLIMFIINSCYEFVEVASFGPFTANSENNLGTLVVNSPGYSSVTVNGYLEDCDQEAVTNGYIAVTNPIGINNNFMPDANGNFSFTQLVCSGSTGFSLYALDYDAGIYSNVINITATSGIVELDTITLCNIMDSFYISFAVDGGATVTITDSLFATIVTSQGSEALQISGTDNSTTDITEVFLQIVTDESLSDLESGITIISNSSLWMSASIKFDGLYYFTMEEPSIIYFEIIGGIGTVIEGTFIGTFFQEQGSGSDSYPGTISFKVLVL